MLRSLLERDIHIQILSRPEGRWCSVRKAHFCAAAARAAGSMSFSDGWLGDVTVCTPIFRARLVSQQTVDAFCNIGGKINILLQLCGQDKFVFKICASLCCLFWEVEENLLELIQRNRCLLDHFNSSTDCCSDGQLPLVFFLVQSQCHDSGKQILNY